jgi:aminotransferase
MPRLADLTQRTIEAMSIKYNNVVYELKRQGHRVITLSYGEAYFDIPLYGFDDLPRPALYHYSHSRGVPELRDVVSRHYRTQYGVPVDPASEVIITGGSKAAIYYAFACVLNPGDEVLIPEPCWVSYPEQVKMCHGVPIGVPYRVPLSDLDSYTSSRTRAIVINNPQNPSGKVYSQAELRSVMDLASRHDLFVIVDEAYSDYPRGEPRFISVGSLDPEKRYSIILNSLSKNLGMSGWRLGYAIANRDVTDQLLKVHQHVQTCPATVLEYYVAKHFDELMDITRPQLAALDDKRARVAGVLDELGLAYLPGTATFYFFVSIEPSRLTSKEFATRLLEEHHVSTIPGIGYGASTDSFVRVSIGTEDEPAIRDGLTALAALIRATS